MPTPEPTIAPTPAPTAEPTPEPTLTPEECLIDLPVLLRCGLSFAPADAVPEVRERVHRVLAERGGNGAVREVCELLVKARGHWDELLTPYFHVGEPD